MNLIASHSMSYAALNQLALKMEELAEFMLDKQRGAAVANPAIATGAHNMQATQTVTNWIDGTTVLFPNVPRATTKRENGFMLEAYTGSNINRRNAIKILVGLPVSGLAFASALSLQGCSTNGIEGDWVATDYEAFGLWVNDPPKISLITMHVSRNGTFSLTLKGTSSERGHHSDTLPDRKFFELGRRQYHLCTEFWNSKNDHSSGDAIFELSTDGRTLSFLQGSTIRDYHENEFRTITLDGYMARSNSLDMNAKIRSFQRK